MAISKLQTGEYPTIPNWDYYRNRYDIVIKAYKPFLIKDLPDGYMKRFRWNFANRTFRIVISLDGHTYKDWRVWRARDPISNQKFDDLITLIRQKWELILH